MTINAQYQLAKTSTFGESVTATALGSHMAKNSEWGAVAYLGDSKYGTKGAAIAKSNTGTSYYTGGSSTINTIYTTNKTQSTTLNATGIYDMSGGAWEYVASYVYFSNNSNLTDNGGTSSGDLFGTESEQNSSTAYKTVYPSSYSDCSSIKGDAIYETSTAASGNATAWHSSYAGFPDSNTPFFIRSGSYSNTNPGSFYLRRSSGIDNSLGSFRPVLAF
jgi:formylglycine-generating enzyme required for sulfatase activity